MSRLFHRQRFHFESGHILRYPGRGSQSKLQSNSSYVRQYDTTTMHTCSDTPCMYGVHCLSWWHCNLHGAK